MNFLKKIILWVRMIKMDSLPVSNNYTFDRLHRGFELPSNPKQQKQIKFEVFTEERKGLSLNQDGQSLKVPVQSQVREPTV